MYTLAKICIFSKTILPLTMTYNSNVYQIIRKTALRHNAVNMKQMLFGQKVYILTPCKVQISQLNFFYTPASSRRKSLLTVLTAFHSRHLETTLSEKAKGIFSKLKSSHSIPLLKILLQWFHMALITYLRSLPWPAARSHLITSPVISSPPYWLSSFNSTGPLSLSSTK